MTDCTTDDELLEYFKEVLVKIQLSNLHIDHVLRVNQPPVIADIPQ